MNLKLVALMAIPLLGVRVAHTAAPSLWMASALSVFACLGMVIGVGMLRRAALPIHGAVVMAAGALANGLVLIANNGVMPVHGLSSEAGNGVWRSAEQGGHLLFLADRMSLAGCSPGDLLVLAGLLLTLGLVWTRARGRGQLGVGGSRSAMSRSRWWISADNTSRVNVAPGRSNVL